MHLVDLTLLYGPQSGGVKTYLTEKRRWMAKRTHIRHTLVIPRQSPAIADRSVVGIRSLPMPFACEYRLPVGRVAPVLERLDPDVIEVGDPYHFAWVALRVGKRRGVPVIGFYHSDLPRVLGRRLGGPVRAQARRYVRQLYSRFDLVLAPSEVIVAELRDLGIEQARFQPLGVDTEVFHPRRANREALGAALGIPEGTGLLIYAGRFSPEKNLPLLFEAIRRLGPSFHLLMVGGGMRIPRAPNVTWVPFQSSRERLATLIASSDVFVHPGEQETFGLAVVEAMACGIPVVGMRAGGVMELVDERSGILVEPGRPQAFADAVRDVFERGTQALGASARLRAERHYGWERAIQLLVAQYAQVCALPRLGDEIGAQTACR